MIMTLKENWSLKLPLTNDKNFTSEKTFILGLDLKKVAEYKLHRTLQHSKVVNVFSTTKGHLTAPHQTSSEPQLLSVA